MLLLRQKKDLKKLFPILSLVIMMGLCFFIRNFNIILLPGVFTIFLFHWLVYRIDLISPVFLVILGCFYDIFMGQRLGLMEVLFLISYFTILHLRKHIIPLQFTGVWVAYGLFSFFYGALYICLLFLDHHQWFIYISFFMSFIFSLAIYPLCSFLLIILYNRR